MEKCKVYNFVTCSQLTFMNYYKLVIFFLLGRKENKNKRISMQLKKENKLRKTEKLEVDQIKINQIKVIF